jgi:pectinacetylesterase
VPKCDADGTDTSCFKNFVKSLDGTRAFYHVDPVPGSRQWVVFFEGGGACGQMMGLNAAEACFAGTQATVGFDGYATNRADAHEMTTRHASGTYTVPNLKTGTGILSTDAANPYAGYNRVWVDKSSFDRFMGDGTDNTQPYNGDDIELYFHGRRIVRSMLKDLARSNGVIAVGGEDVPDLKDAASVLFVGESGGSGGLIHNAEWLSAEVAALAPDVPVNFAPASRMLPWLEAEAFFAGTGDLWSDVSSGSTSVAKNPAGGGPAVVPVTYSSAAYEPGGSVHDLLASWGDPASTAWPFLDASCLAEHGAADWRCFDEGHVALYHADENLFFYESLLDGVHAGPGSPNFWMETADFGAGFVSVFPGFVWNPAGNRNYTQARLERVLHTIDQVLLNPAHRGARGFYAPTLDAHTQVKTTGFWTATLDCPLGAPTWSFADALSAWEEDNNLGVCGASGCNYAVVEDTLAANRLTYSFGCMGGGWTP